MVKKDANLRVQDELIKDDGSRHQELMEKLEKANKPSTNYPQDTKHKRK